MSLEWVSEGVRCQLIVAIFEFRVSRSSKSKLNGGEHSYLRYVNFSII